MAQDSPPESAIQVMRQVFAHANQGTLSLTDLSAVGKLLTDAQNFSMAAELYRVWLARTNSPLAYRVHCDLGDALVALKDIPAAKQAFQKALELNPTFARARTSLSQL